MLFNSYIFLLGFLPVVLLVCFLLARWRSGAAKVWLIFASFFFYSWWYPPHLAVILGALLFTYGIGRAMLGTGKAGWRRGLLVAGIAGDLGVLAYFKYFHFFVDTLNAVAQAGFRVDPIVLPLAISFFTFQKVAFLMDVYQGKITECRFWDFCLFVAFFPQLIAGPIVHYREVVPQFRRAGVFRFGAENLSVGLTIFAIGLFKKVAVADTLAPIADRAFAAGAAGGVPAFWDGWVGTTAYALQLYFDFSGYSDMAIGLARMFGILLPMNFCSPYKACSIVEFWRRWHITLSHFLRDYLYVPLGGNRLGRARQFVNLTLTMLLGGLWHGAGWTFVVWGGLHGFYLAVSHAWERHAAGRWRSTFWRVPAWGLTFLCVLVGWVFFRAENMATAGNMLGGMFLGLGGWMGQAGVGEVVMVMLPLVMALVLPNTQEIMARWRPALDFDKVCPRPAGWLRWDAGMGWGLAVSLLLGVSLCCMAKPARFLYFQF